MPPPSDLPEPDRSGAETSDSVRALQKAFLDALGQTGTVADRQALLTAILALPAFNRLRQHPTPAEAVDRAASPDPAFVKDAYLWLLGRDADADGLRHYAAALAGGEDRAAVVAALSRSDEFGRRLEGQPQDTQLCELANPAKWDNAEWLDILRDLRLSEDKLLMHRKPYEFAQLIYGCRRLGVLRDDARVLSVGAGHEGVLYWLANHVRQVVATDRYEGTWQAVQGREGDPNVLRDPSQYAPFAYRRDHLLFMRMDGRSLGFAAGSFDIAYSLSSIEHFGGMAGAVDTLRDMGRVLKRGGIAVVATEYVLQGPRHEETFLPGDIAELVRQSGLQLVEPIDEGVYRRYVTRPVDLYRNPYQTPHMVVRFDDTVFTTVMMFLRKP